jgi:hypothetical protein
MKRIPSAANEQPAAGGESEEHRSVHEYHQNKHPCTCETRNQVRAVEVQYIEELAHSIAAALT